MAKQFTLGKSERLKSRKQIEQLFSEGKSFSVFPFKVYYFVSSHVAGSSSQLQFGVGISGRNFKKAVDRNRIKRLTREAYRLQKKELQETLKQKKIRLNVFFIYIDKQPTDFNSIKIKVDVALKKFLQLAEG